MKPQLDGTNSSTRQNTMIVKCSATGCDSTDVEWYRINGSSSLVKMETPICKNHLELAREEGLI